MHVCAPRFRPLLPLSFSRCQRIRLGQFGVPDISGQRDGRRLEHVFDGRGSRCQDVFSLQVVPCYTLFCMLFSSYFSALHFLIYAKISVASPPFLAFFSHLVTQSIMSLPSLSNPDFTTDTQPKPAISVPLASRFAPQFLPVAHFFFHFALVSSSFSCNFI